jgi:hypothetical protein
MKKKELKERLEHAMTVLHCADLMSESQWKRGVSHPQIIGYLQGTMRALYKSYNASVNLKKVKKKEC